MHLTLSNRPWCCAHLDPDTDMRLTKGARKRGWLLACGQPDAARGEQIARWLRDQGYDAKLADGTCPEYSKEMEYDEPEQEV